MTHIPVITIDGPTGSGKTTLSTLLAKHLGWHWLNSGFLYRALAYQALQSGVDLEDSEALVQLLNGTAFNIKGQSVFIDRKEVTELLRSPNCSQAASQVAVLTSVREALLSKQLAFKQPPGLVADGRDMGTTVFPDADLKVFLKASCEERAKRRHHQLKQQGMLVDLSELTEVIADRDKRDRLRTVSPLKPAEDAILVDTTDKKPKTVVEHVLKVWRHESFKRLA